MYFKASEYFLVFVFASFCLRSILGEIKSFTYKAKALNIRYVYSGTIAATLKDTSLKLCGITCYHSPVCVSFNYAKKIRTCEMLNTAPYKDVDGNLVEEEGWNHYTFVVPKLTGDEQCPDGTILAPVQHAPLVKYHPDMRGYVCLNNSWVTNQYNNGKTNCRMDVTYDGYIIGYHTSDGNPFPYQQRIQQCTSNNCFSFEFNFSNRVFKFSNQVRYTPGGNKYRLNGIGLWYATCD